MGRTVLQSESLKSEEGLSPGGRCELFFSLPVCFPVNLQRTEFERRLEKPRSHSTPASPRGRLGGVGVRGRVGGFSPSGESIKAWLNAIRKCAAVSDLRRQLWDEERRPGPGPGPRAPLSWLAHSNARHPHASYSWRASRLGSLRSRRASFSTQPAGPSDTPDCYQPPVH